MIEHRAQRDLWIIKRNSPRAIESMKQFAPRAWGWMSSAADTKDAFWKTVVRLWGRLTRRER